MNPNEPEPTFLDGRSSDRLAGLVFELAAQLHAERAQRIALQAALRSRGLLDDSDVATAAAAENTAAEITAALELSQQRLFDVIVERDDVSGPLRHEAPDPKGSR